MLVSGRFAKRKSFNNLKALGPIMGATVPLWAQGTLALVINL